MRIRCQGRGAQRHDGCGGAGGETCTYKVDRGKDGQEKGRTERRTVETTHPTSHKSHNTERTPSSRRLLDEAESRRGGSHFMLGKDEELSCAGEMGRALGNAHTRTAR